MMMEKSKINLAGARLLMRMEAGRRGLGGRGNGKVWKSEKKGESAEHLGKRKEDGRRGWNQFVFV